MQEKFFREREEHHTHLRLVIADMTEDVKDFVATLTPDEQVDEIEENAGLSERELFNDIKVGTVFVMPHQPDANFLEYYRQLFGFQMAPMILSPRTHSGIISSDIRQDAELMQQLKSYLAAAHSTEIVSYAHSEGIAELVKELKASIEHEDEVISTPEANQDFEVSELGTKSFLRRIYEQETTDSGFVMPEGKVFENDMDGAIEYAVDMYLRDRKVVLKTNKGHSGLGVLILRDGSNDELPTTSREECAAALKAKLVEAYWAQFPIVVEKFIPADSSVAGGFPSIEFFIDDNGPQFLYLCGMSVTPEGVFQGVAINSNHFSPEIEAEMRKTGEYVSRKLYELGYRGYHDLDLIIGQDGAVYVDEANLRRTGGTHVHNTARKLFGPDYINRTAVIAENTYRFQGLQQPSFEEVRDILKPILYSDETQTGVVLCSAELLKQNKLAYIIFAPTPEEASRIRSEMVKILE